MTDRATIDIIRAGMTVEDHAHLLKAVRDLLIEKGLITAERLADLREEIDTRGPLLGARLVAEAWIDQSFKALLLRDPKEAVFQLLGIRISHGPELAILENTSDVHHVIVCTLCSCYPKAILGLPPAWYKSFSYRSRMVVEPLEILRQFGTEVPPDTEIRVVDSTADLRYMVLPLRPPGTEGMDRDALAKLVRRDDLIGTTFPSAPI